jgi:hypothetical protein
MPRRADSHTAYWLDTRGILHGYPQQKPLPPRIAEPGASVARLKAHSVVTLEDVTWQDRLDGTCGGRVILSFRDRQGFRWEREIGLNDYVNQADAAQLLGVPLMRVNRWIRKGGTLKSKKRHGFSVVRVKDLYELAIRLELKVPRGHRRALVGSDQEQNERMIRRVESQMRKLIKQAKGDPEELDRLLGVRRLSGKEAAEVLRGTQPKVREGR